MSIQNATLSNESLIILREARNIIKELNNEIKNLVDEINNLVDENNNLFDKIRGLRKDLSFDTCMLFATCVCSMVCVGLLSESPFRKAMLSWLNTTN
jgi:hypothetical protein